DRNGVVLDLPHASASSIKTTFQCPAKQLFKMVDAPKGPTDTSHIDFGSATHEFIEGFYQKDKDSHQRLGPEDMKRALAPFVNDTTRKKYLPTVESFFAWEDEHNYRDSGARLEIEERFLFKDPGNS
ncbi:hypothetical protein EOM86_11340, partial [Candidatus Nomurabacteria bacterium]|nr:hypothetical protein [Candidatus Nomurabacteria bacterium]